MTARSDALRASRLLFERAMAANVSLVEARRLTAVDRWCRADARLAARTAVGEAPQSEGRPLQWWQK